MTRRSQRAALAFASGNSFSSEWCGKPPIGNVIRGVFVKEKLPNGEGKTSELGLGRGERERLDESGLCASYTERVIIPVAKHLNPGMTNEDGKRSVEVCDGTQVHLSYERLRLCTSIKGETRFTSAY